MFGAWGFPVVMIGATLGAALAFLVARYLLRKKIKQAMNQRVAVAAIIFTTAAPYFPVIFDSNRYKPELVL